MRRLHAVGIREKFWASGVYIHDAYIPDDEDPDDGYPDWNIRTQWTIHEVGDGARLVRMDIDYEETGFILSEALIEPDGTISRYMREGFVTGKPRQKYTYTLDEKGLLILYSGGADTKEEFIEMPADTMLVCPQWLLEGFAWHTWIQQPNRRLFRLSSNKFEERETPNYWTEMLKFRGQEVETVRVVNYFTSFWLDPHGIALKIEDDGNDYDLTQFALAR